MNFERAERNLILTSASCRKFAVYTVVNTRGHNPHKTEGLH
jgi:hypothetical protein